MVEQSPSMADALENAWSIVKYGGMDEEEFDRRFSNLDVQLVDDGTLDTVISVSKDGKNEREYRFNYGDSMEGIDESLGDETPSYDEFVEECMEEAKDMYIEDIEDEEHQSYMADVERYGFGGRNQ